MSTNNKTLADAQPGGRVKLGDALLPCPFCGNGAEFIPYKDNGLTLKCKSMGCIQRHQRTLRYGIEWLRASMTEHWNARALTAQPSPGGQGDALLREVCSQLESLDCGACIGSYAPMEDLHGRIAAHLAARQPVASNQSSGNSGELAVDSQPVGELHLLADGFYKIVYDDASVPDESFACTGALDAALRRFDQISARWNAHLFVRFANNTRDCTVPNATPAQAVDLGDFKALYRAYVRLLESGRDRIRDLGGTCDPVDVMEANDVDLQAARRVLDSQAVGNG